MEREAARRPMSMNRQDWWTREGDPKRGFRYLGRNGQPLSAERTLARIDALVIPPAWTDVHIAPDPKRKIQAWGRDQRGRKQYIYSEQAVADRDARKWNRVLKVARSLPALRAATNTHLQRPRLDREKVLATVVRLMTRAYFRAGSERYAVENRTFGICTLKKKHLEIRDRSLHFSYTGKRSQDQRQVVADTPLVEIVEDLMELPGPRLFQYRVGRKRRPVTAEDVNRYIRQVLGQKVTSKDLRTFGGTVRAATVLADIGPARSEREAHKNVVMTCRLVASELGNTPAICRKAYIHPAVLEEYETAGRTMDSAAARRAARTPRVESREPVDYYPEERALIQFLEKYG
jgi:DNA topoisomerase-1